MTMTYQGSIQDLQVAEVVDSAGDKVGRVGQVYLTNDSQEPSWVTVNTGLFGTKETFIPLAEASYADGIITVPYEKSFIKDAPHVDEDGEISREEEDELYRYYGVQEASADVADVAPAAEQTAGDAETVSPQAPAADDEGTTAPEEDPAGQAPDVAEDAAAREEADELPAGHHLPLAARLEAVRRRADGEPSGP